MPGCRQASRFLATAPRRLAHDAGARRQSIKITGKPACIGAWFRHHDRGAHPVADLSVAVVAYSSAARRTSKSIDGTTEVAALVVLALGFVAGIGYLAVSSGIAAVIVLVLAEKTRIHAILHKIGEVELRAAVLFAALGLV